MRADRKHRQKPGRSLWEQNLTRARHTLKSHPQYLESAHNVSPRWMPPSATSASSRALITSTSLKRYFQLCARSTQKTLPLVRRAILRIRDQGVASKELGRFFVGAE
jgi:hypothetical protein